MEYIRQAIAATAAAAVGVGFGWPLTFPSVVIFAPFITVQVQQIEKPTLL